MWMGVNLLVVGESNFVSCPSEKRGESTLEGFGTRGLELLILDPIAALSDKGTIVLPGGSWHPIENGFDYS